jgi:uncharacterized protein
MLALLSPSKTQDFTPTDKVATVTQAPLLQESAMLIDELQKQSPAQIAKLMSVSDKLADLNYTRFGAWHLPFTPANAKPAALAFKGDVYDGLDAESLSSSELDYAQHCLRILSGLYGVLRPLDLMQAYRLEMKTPLVNPRGKDLYQFWGSRITDLLNAQLAEEKTDMVVNLASNEYFKAVQPSALKAKLVTAHFKEDKGGTLKVVALFAKRARGRMARYIVQNRIEDTAGLKDFNADGYRFQPRLSTDSDLVFARKAA